jgi:transcriptional regulator with XRE-family HTH domain
MPSHCHPVSRQLGQRLRALRKAQGLSLLDLAARLGWSKTKVLRLENGTCQLTPEHLHALCAALGVEVRVQFDPVSPHCPCTALYHVSPPPVLPAVPLIDAWQA